MYKNKAFSAFVSYSHADARWAADLQKFLERYRVPRQLASKFDSSRPLRPVFRDETELTSGKLSDAIEGALSASAALVVVCSPAAANSKWVDAEIRRFRELHGDSRIFPVIVAGMPHAEAAADECFPPALRGDPLSGFDTTEHLAADVRPAGKRDAFLRIAAALLGVGFDALKRRDQQRRQLQFAGVTTIALIVAVVTTGLAINASIARKEAELRRDQADDLIGFMVGDLRDKLQPIGRIDVLVDVGDKAMEYLSSLPEGDDAAVLDKRAMTLRQIGEVRVEQGRFDDALASFQDALAIYQSMDLAGNADAAVLYELALTHFWIADAHLRRLDHESAEQEILNYRNVTRRVVDLSPGNDDYLLELSMADTNLGTLAYRQGRFEEARRRFVAAEDAVREVIARSPDNEFYQSILAGTLSWLGSTLLALGDTADGVALQREMIEIGRRSLANSDDMRERFNLAQDMQVLSGSLHSLGEYEEAISVDDEALALFAELVAHDPENKRWERGLALGQAKAARHRLSACRLADVPAMINGSATLLERQLILDASDTTTSRYLQENRIEQARLLALEGNIDEALALSEATLDTLLARLRERPDEMGLRRDTARAAAIVAMAGSLGDDDSAPNHRINEAIGELRAEDIDDAVVNEWIDVTDAILSRSTEKYREFPGLLPACGTGY